LNFSPALENVASILKIILILLGDWLLLMPGTGVEGIQYFIVDTI